MRDRELGHKLGPRLVDLTVQAVLAARRGLAPHEAKVQAAATQAVIDRMGHELADHYRPLLAPLLAGEHGELHPDVHAFLAAAAAGNDQWKSAGTFLFGSIQGALGTVINNAVAPVAYALTRPSPNLRLDPATVAQLAARGLYGLGNAVEDAASQGIDSDKLGALVEAARTPPDPSVLAEMVNRGLISEGEADEWYNRLAIPAALWGPLRAMRRQLLSPADAALAVLRGTIAADTGAAIAARTGLDAADFAVLIDNTGEPPGLVQLQEAWRRGIIDQARFARGVRQSRVRDEWLPALEAMRFAPMPTADAADAALRGHLTPDQAQAIAEANGLRPGDWPAFYANQGNPPADVQMLELWRRGYATESDVDRALRQGRIRDEWIPYVKRLRTVRLPTADALDAWLRGHLDHAAAEQIIRDNGLDPRDITAAFGNAGNPLGLDELLEAFRRKFIDEARFTEGFRQSRYRDEWAGTALRLRYRPMTTADAIEASVQGWISRDRAQEISEQNGLDPADFAAAWNTAGQPLSRTELEALFNRGEIGQATVEQGLRESRIKDRWIGDAVKLHVRIPQEYQVIRMIGSGVIDHAQGVRLLMDAGYTPQVAGWLITEGELTGTGRHRELSAAAVSALYEARQVSRATAAAMLEASHYSAASAALVLGLADHNRAQKILDTGITGVRNLYLAYRLDELGARDDLHKLQLPQDAIDDYLLVWGIERRSKVRQLTEAQIVKAHKLNLFDPQDPQCNDEEALARLEQMGYDKGDAELLLKGA